MERKNWYKMFEERERENPAQFRLDVGLAPDSSLEDIVKAFIESGADVEGCDAEEWTLLHFACIERWLEVVKTLVRKGWDLEAKDKFGRTPVLNSAIWGTDPCIVEHLMDCGADVDISDKDGQTLMYWACKNGWLDVVKALVRKGWDLTAKYSPEMSPLWGAADGRHLDIVEYLIDCGADVDICDDNGVTLLHLVCEEGWVEVVKSVVSRECDLNTKNMQGKTPIMVAADNSYLSIVEFLIDCGADVDVCDEYQSTLLHLACEKGWLEVVKYLTTKALDVNAQTGGWNTPLHLAVDEGNLEIIKHLLNAGADCNITNIFGETEFSIFIRKSVCLEVISLFISKGAYFQVPDYDVITDNSILKEGILQNTQLCTAVIINFYNAHLRKLYEIPAVSGILPSLEQLQVSNDIANNCSAVVEDISENVKLEIQTKGCCDVLNARPIFLRSLCLKSLLEYYKLH